MPQKQNPDALGTDSRKIGTDYRNQVALTTTIKGLPLAYNKDIAETQEPLFEPSQLLGHCLKVAAGSCAR